MLSLKAGVCLPTSIDSCFGPEPGESSVLKKSHHAPNKTAAKKSIANKLFILKNFPAKLRHKLSRLGHPTANIALYT